MTTPSTRFQVRRLADGYVLVDTTAEAEGRVTDLDNELAVGTVGAVDASPDKVDLEAKAAELNAREGGLTVTPPAEPVTEE